jgi:HK97 family phage portal protein
MAASKTPKRAATRRKTAGRRAYGVSRQVADTEAMESWLITAMGGRASASGENVTPETARGLAAYYASITNISEDMAKLPLGIYRRLDRGREPLPGHRLHKLLNESPNPKMTAMAFRESMNQWAMGNGNGIAEIEWTNRGDVQYLWPKHPSYCSVRESPDGALFVRITEPGQPARDVPYRDIFHLRGRGDGVWAQSVARTGCDSLGRALAAQTFSGAFFANGAHLGTVLEHPGKFKDPKARENLRESLAQAHAGAPNAFKTYVLEEGMKLSAGKFGIPPEEAQLLEVMQFTVEDVARWLRCPLSKIQYFLRAQGWSTLELLNTDYVVDTLMPYDVRWSQEIQRKLLIDSTLYARHNFMGLLRGDAKSRMEFYTAGMRIGVLNRNDIREREDMNPVPGGETYYIESSNLQPITTGEDAAGDDVNFKREVVKALIADGTIGDVIFNLTDGRKLLEQVNVPVYPGEQAEPWLPVVAAAGPLVNGETVTDSEGDVVGGDVEESAQPTEPSEEPDGQAQEGDEKVGGPADEGSSPAQGEPKATESASEPQAALSVTTAADVVSTVPDGLEALREPIRKAHFAALTRIVRKERKALACSAKKRQGDEWRTWLGEFYADLEAEMQENVQPLRTALMATSGIEAEDAGFLSAAWCQGYCSDRVKQLTDVDAGSDWETLIEVPGEPNA